jgi:hypothetical protein
VSLAVGFDPRIALRNAVFAQMPDEVNALDAAYQEESRLTAPGGMVTWTKYERDLIQRGLHALTGGLSKPERDTTTGALHQMKPGSMEFGFLLHRFGDTYAHSKMGNETVLYDTGMGHALDLNNPDLIHVRRDLYEKFVAALYETLLPLARAAGGAPRMSAEQIRPLAKEIASVTVILRRPTPGAPYAYDEVVLNDPSEKAQVRRMRDLCQQKMNIQMDPYAPETEDCRSWMRFKKGNSQFMRQLDGAEISWPDVVAAVHTVARLVGQEPKRDLNYPLRPQ